jgi:hypothetical protein
MDRVEVVVMSVVTVLPFFRKGSIWKNKQAAKYNDRQV